MSEAGYARVVSADLETAVREYFDLDENARIDDIDTWHGSLDVTVREVEHGD